MSVVQTFPSLHWLDDVHSVQPPMAVPWHIPPAQKSLAVQLWPSSHGSELSTNSQPDVGLQESSVHSLKSSQVTAPPPTQAPPEQLSPDVQALPSSQATELFVNWHPVGGWHASSVQGLPSLQVGGGPPTQTPPVQKSPIVQASPSEHETELFVKTQIPA